MQSSSGEPTRQENFRKPSKSLPRKHIMKITSRNPSYQGFMNWITTKRSALSQIMKQHPKVHQNMMLQEDNHHPEFEQQLMNLVTALEKLSVEKQGALIQKIQATINDTYQPGPQKDSERQLPARVVHSSAWVKYKKLWRGFPLPVLTCDPLGRFGNVMGQYATLYALAHLYNVSVVVHPKMKKQFVNIFPNTSLPDLPEYPFEIQMFNKFKEDLRREFTFTSKYTAIVQSFLLNITEERKARKELNPVFIGFHIRRTDYIKHAQNQFGASLPDQVYFDRAMQYYRNKFPGKAVFIVASDDMVFIKSKLEKYKDVIFSPGTSHIMDLAILTSCNHSIVTMGSFGFWSAYLTGGEVVYPDIDF
ncbi:galactoside alpha-(1,2)-fucosyltransferase 1 isoform X3 [Procambarus clarkii]|uniref:galactoside alpha-(1,2)-fucosyltransferase 1 isoform X3 n=1 Tax=Procambarus clarkii TaxID=6728 RepID=UPI0037423F28